MVNRKNFFRRRSASSLGGGGASGSAGGDGEYPTRKLVIVGDGTCGKTSLLFAFTRDEFYEAYVPTIFETSIVDMEIRPGKVIALSLWDTAGQEAYARLRPLSYTDTHVILICFAMNSRDSFNNVKDTWFPEVRHYCPKAALLLIGCKNDLASTASDCVTHDEVEKLANSIGATSQFLCSAKTRENVTEVFETAASLAYEAGKKKSKMSAGLAGCFGGKSRKKTEA